MKKRILRIFNTLTLCLFMVSPMLAQNMITNGGFENSGGYTSDYTRIYGPNGVEAGCYTIDNTTDHHGSGVSWPEPSGSTGRFMQVNGFGGDINPNKVVWTPQQPISVLTNTYYTFSCRVVNLNVYISGQINPARLQLKINGSSAGTVNQLPTNNDWHNWTVQWYSGSADQAVIQIVDMYTGNSGLGDDYALDDMSFMLDAAYSLTANSFTYPYCGDIMPIEIDLTGHYIMTYPSGGNSAPPMQVKIRKAEYYTWATSITTNHGAAYVGSDNKIYYTPNEGYFGSDSFQYQISRFGLESYNTITVNIGNVPTNCSPQGLPTNNLLCISNISSFNPSATWSSNGSNITASGWQFKKIGVTDWQDSYTFQTWVPQWGGVGEYCVRFFAENNCGMQYSDPYNFNICNTPEWITQPTINTICTGSAEPTVSINWNYNTGVQTWQYKRGNGSWTDFVWGEFDLQPGDQVRYRVTYDACSGNPLTSQTINVVSGPQFNTNIPVSFDAGYCPNTQVQLPQIQSSWYNAYGMTVTSGWYYVNYDPSGSPSYVPITGNSIILNNGSVSVTPCLQNTECGFTPFFPAFDLVVYEAPAIEGLEELPDSLGPVCSGTPLSSILPALSPDGHYTDFGWEISAGQNPSGYQSNLPQTLSLTDNGRWLRYRVEGCPQYNLITSDPIRLWVGGAPTLNTNQINPLGTVCAGTNVTSLADVHVTNWNLFNNPDESFERWEVNLNGTWTEFTQFALSHNGCQVRYHAHNQCGDTIVSAGVVNVTEGPSFNNPGAPLNFADYYCDGEYLTLPTPPSFDPHGINVNDNYWAYFDGTEYHRITSSVQLHESWNGYQITYVLESDCGGEIYYPTPYTLTVLGNPVVTEISLNGSSTFCVGTPISLDVNIDWHLCTQNTQESSWRYAPANQPNNYSNFNPNVGIPEAGTFLINYHAVAIECNADAYGTPLSVTVEAAPEFVNTVPFELDRFCEDESLQLPANPVITGHVDESGWQISEGLNPDGVYTEVVPGYVLTLADNGRWLRYYALGCNVPIQHREEIHVDGKPSEEYSIADRICKGQTLSYQLVNSNGYPVTQREWRLGSTSGNPFNPDAYTFDDEGEYSIYYRVGNDCGWSEFEGPLHLSVTAGPEFVDMTYGTEYVCEGTTVGELLQQSGITEPSLVDPSIPHHPLGWFINDQAVEMSSVIFEGYHGAELRYGVSGDCSDVPVYSRGPMLYVFGRPEVTQMPSDWDFCEGDVVELPNPDINFHNSEEQVTGHWQIQSNDGSWVNLPTTWSADNNGAQVRFHLTHGTCPNLDNDSWENTVTIYTAPTINDDDLPTNTLISLCYEGSLGIAEPEVLPETNVRGWQVSANGTDWSTEIEGHVFNPSHVDNVFNGKYLRYHAESTQCPNLEDNSQVYTIQLMDSPSINSADWPNQVPYCSGGSLGIDIPDGLPGEWQVSSNGSNWSTELEGYVFDPNHIDDFFDGKLLRYYVHTSCGDAESKVLTMILLGAPNMPIIGETQVAMMNSFWTGIYDYYIDSTNLVHPVQWSLEGADWQVKPLGMARCLVYVNSIGTAVLHARITNELCSNEFEIILPINATHFGVEEENAPKVTVYPNPTRNTVTIEAECIESLRLTNMMGQVLDMRECDKSDSVVLNLSGYTPSVYLLEVKTVNGVAKKRLILYR